jgi:hypothetical protein
MTTDQQPLDSWQHALSTWVWLGCALKFGLNCNNKKKKKKYKKSAHNPKLCAQPPLSIKSGRTVFTSFRLMESGGESEAKLKSRKRFDEEKIYLYTKETL